MNQNKNIVLQTEKVLLRPVEAGDFDDFLKLTQQDTDMWEFFSRNLADAHQLKDWVGLAVSESEAGTRFPFTIIDKASGLIAGSSSIGNISWYDKRAEVGWSWLGPEFRSTGINRNSKFLLMGYAFEVMKLDRVEFKTGVLNIRARKGLEKIGGVEEGILREHSMLWSGKRRTSVFYSVLKDEWPILKTTIFADLNNGLHMHE